jgi:hypothetical protein
MRGEPNFGKLRFEARLASVATWFAAAFEALPWLVIFAIFVAAIFGVTVRLYARYGWRTAAGTAGLVGLSFALRLIGKRCLPALESRKARAWGRYHEHFLASDNRAPILLLRSFRHSMIARGTKAPLIAQAIRAAVPTGPVITLGDESDIASAGAGTFYINGPDQDWTTLFKACAWASSVVVVVPETTRSLVSEMLALARSNFLSKTLILMPPAGEKPDELFGSPNWKRWAAIREGLGQIGLHLPDYDRYGMAYVPREDLAPARHWQLGWPPASHIGAAVAEVAAGQTVGRAGTATLIEVLGIRCDGRRLIPLSGDELQARVASFANRYAPDPTQVAVGSIAESPEALAAAVIMPPVARAPALQSSNDPTRYDTPTEPSHEPVEDNSSTEPSHEPVEENSSFDWDEPRRLHGGRLSWLVRRSSAN